MLNYDVPDPIGADYKDGDPMYRQYVIFAYCRREFVEVNALARVPEYYKEDK